MANAWPSIGSDEYGDGRAVALAGGVTGYMEAPGRAGPGGTTAGTGVPGGRRLLCRFMAGGHASATFPADNRSN